MGGEDTCPRGLPDMTPAERDEGAKTGKTMVTVLSVVPALIGLASPFWETVPPLAPWATPDCSYRRPAEAGP